MGHHGHRRHAHHGGGNGKLVLLVILVVLGASYYNDGFHPDRTFDRLFITDPSTATEAPTNRMRTAARCKLRDAAHDPRCTPGAVDGRVTQGNRSRVCPTAPAHQPNERTRSRVLRRYGLRGDKGASYIVTPLIPYGIGGTPTVRNLYPLAKAHADDAASAASVLHGKVCSNAWGLAIAQGRAKRGLRAVQDEIATSE